MPRNRVFTAVLALCLSMVHARAATVLFDFENGLNDWKKRHAASQLTLSKDFPYNGTRGLLFRHPQWLPEKHGGHSIWPAMETRKVLRDWSSFDRLVIPVYNDSARAMAFGVYVTDSKVPWLNGFSHLTQLPPQTITQLVLPLHKRFQEKHVDAKDISFVHFFSENPSVDLALYIDTIQLLKEGESIPDIPSAFKERVAQKQARFFAPFRERIQAEAQALQFQQLSAPIRDFMEYAIASYLKDLSDLEHPQAIITEFIHDAFRWQQLRRTLAAAVAFHAIRPKLAPQPGSEDLILGLATSMEKVFPKYPGFDPLPKDITLSAARNEWESCQLVVMPMGRDRRHVSLELSSLKTAEGLRIPPSAITIAPVGFVETKHLPPYRIRHKGWYSDPILTFLNSVPVRRGEAQPFWVQVRIPRQQPAGIYQGSLEVTVDGQRQFTVPLTLSVRSFTLPDKLALPTAMSFSPSIDRRVLNLGTVNRTPDAPVFAWEKHKMQWANMLADYGITYGTLYYIKHTKQCPWAPWALDFDILLKLKKQNRLGLFNLGFFEPATEKPDNDYGLRKIIDDIRPRYEKAKRLGLLKHAYIYGCDEITKDKFHLVNRAAGILKKHFPGVPIFTTTYNYEFGVDGVLSNLDWFCPHTVKYSSAQAAKARKLGKQVWYYICAGPDIYPNNYVESHGMEPRLIAGAMAAKFRPDGFLYYALASWNSLTSITTGPYTGFNPESYRNYNGDGMWVYPGPDATPLSSIRLENFRDGMEDLAYVKLLEHRLKSFPANSPQAQDIRRAMEVPATLVGEKPNQVTLHPRHLLSWRRRMADALEKYSTVPARP